MICQPDESTSRAFSDHSRRWRSCRYVYPVISRRAGGVGIGVNLNPERACNFACVYCQVDRTDPGPSHGVDLGLLRAELRLALDAARSGQLWDEPRFADVPADRRRLNDIAFSGDGEPTCVAGFDQAVQAAADARTEAGLEALKLIVITNATRLDSPPCLRPRHRHPPRQQRGDLGEARRWQRGAVRADQPPPRRADAQAGSGQHRPDCPAAPRGAADDAAVTGRSAPHAGRSGRLRPRRCRRRP
ncbi:MAG: hypothetical protein NT031_07125 [Planctomycetota bacterium]|nr:hypothetical protein [Planctomycetota bacterium]